MKLREQLAMLLSRDKKNFTIATILTFIWGAMCMINQYVLGRVLDDLFINFENRGLININNLFALLILLGSVLLTWTTTYLSCVVTAKFASNSTAKLRNEVFEVLQKQSNKFYDDNSTGDLITKATSDVTQIQGFYIDLGVYCGIITGELIFCLFFVFYIDPILAVITMVSVPINWFVSNYFRKKVAPLSLESRELYSEQTKVVQENIEGAKICRVFDTEKVKLSQFSKINKTYRNKMQDLEKMQAGGAPLIFLITSSTQVILLIVGGLKVINGNLSIGLLITVIMLSRWMFAPINNASTVIIRFGRVKPSIDRVNELIHNVPEIYSKERAIKISEEFKGSIEFNNVSFSYQKEAVLSNVSLRIPESSTTAILGSTGCGKSSLINLIPRYYDVNQGVVKIDGIDVKDLELDSLRKKIGFVDQETFLFSKTIKENIAFGNPDVSDEEIFEVAKIAQIHDFILGLPEGYDTCVGEKGITLSGGQRQRIAIARTILAKPLIVIFDDSLSAVDVATEKEIQEALENFIKNQTTILVTQRLSTTSKVDKCIILKDGQIIEEGVHKELLEKEGVYSKLFESQIDGIMDLTVLQEEAAIG